MSKIIWPSEIDKYEAIGYLAKLNVIDFIEATVPEDKLEKFMDEYAGKCSYGFPYITKAGSKYGYQFRIYLNDTDGCPEFLRTQLDDTYKNRINDTRFIAELVKDFGFRFTRESQNLLEIMQKVQLQGEDEFKWFKRGFNSYTNFLESLSDRIAKDVLKAPNIVEPTHSPKNKGKTVEKINKKAKTALSDEELFTLGWLGEAYIYKMLCAKDKVLLAALGMPSSASFFVTWFNEGYDNNRKWEDKSVGQGCDIIVSSGEECKYIEVKTSKRKNTLFTMTSNEMQKMEEELENYYLVKIDYLERILNGESPDVIVFDTPYETFFKPKKMKEATFRIEGDY